MIGIPTMVVSTASHSINYWGDQQFATIYSILYLHYEYKPLWECVATNIVANWINKITINHHSQTGYLNEHRWVDTFKSITATQMVEVVTDSSKLIEIAKGSNSWTY